MYRNPKTKPPSHNKKSPQDLMLEYLAFIKREPEHERLTPKGYILLMMGRGATKKKGVRRE